MARYKLILIYDGTEFWGYQRQANARTVQGVVEEALRKIGWQGRSILAAGRTDTGVHASGQVVAFDLDWRHPLEALQSALNASLPSDVAVASVQAVEAGFHPRFAAVARRYQYRIFCQESRHPLRERYAWRVWPAVEFGIMQQAAGCLPGTHDFAAFGASPRPEGSTIRSVFRASWQVDEAGLVFEIVANAFLYHMVRRLVFAQVAIGQGKLDSETIRDALAGGSEMIQGLAPPNGLNLVEVVYPP